MDRSVAQGRPADPGSRPAPDPRAASLVALAVGLSLAVAALAVYLATRTDRFYDHFVWQAAAFLEGQAAIRYPVAGSAERPGNCLLPGRPAGRHDRRHRRAASCRSRRCRRVRPAAVRRAVGPGHRRPGAVHDPRRHRRRRSAGGCSGGCPSGSPSGSPTTVFFAFGTVFWYTAQLATTWYQAHIVAVGLTLLAIGLALGADPAARPTRPMPTTRRGRRPSRPRRAGRRPRSPSTGASSSPGSCSGSPARPACPSSSVRRSSCSSGRAAAGGGAAGRRARGGDPGRPARSPTTS